MRYCILGVDPGITTAFAAIDLNGNIIDIQSDKRMGLDRLLSLVNKSCKPIVISCDVNNPPLLVQKIKSIYSARLVTPPYDLKIGEKQNIIKNFFLEKKFEYKFSDLHQRDAYASALYAFNSFRTLFNKIERVLEEKQAEHRILEVKKKLLTGEAESIDDALKIRQEPIMLQPKKRLFGKTEPAENNLLKRDVYTLRENLEKLRIENTGLKNENERLGQKLIHNSCDELKRITEMRKITIESQELKIKELNQRIEKLQELLNLKSQALTNEKIEEMIKKYRSTRT